MNNGFPGGFTPVGNNMGLTCQPNFNGEIRKGDQYYLDASHKNHLEVFDSKGDSRSVLNLDG